MGSSIARRVGAEHRAKLGLDDGRCLPETGDQPHAAWCEDEKREVSKAEQLLALGEPGEVGLPGLCVARVGLKALLGPTLEGDSRKCLRQSSSACSRHDHETHRRRGEHVLGVGRERTDMDAKRAKSGNDGKRHHGHEGFVPVQGAQSADRLGAQQLNDKGDLVLAEQSVCASVRAPVVHGDRAVAQRLGRDQLEPSRAR